MRLRHPTAFWRAVGLVLVLAFGIASILGTSRPEPVPDWSNCYEWDGQADGGNAGLEYLKNFYFGLPDGKVYASAYVETRDEAGTPEVTIEEVSVTPGGITGDVMVQVRVKLDAGETADYRPCIRARSE